jgi:hypothetical protein
MAARAFSVRRARQSSDGPADDEAARRLPPSRNGAELTSSDMMFLRGGAVRRRARMLARLQSMDLAHHGTIDKQKLVGVPCTARTLRANWRRCPRASAASCCCQVVSQTQAARTLCMSESADT